MDAPATLFDDNDKAALLALVSRYTRLFAQREDDEKLKAEVEARIAEANVQFGRLHTAFAVFGFNTKETGTFAKIADFVGRDAYKQALDKGQPAHHPRLVPPAHPEPPLPPNEHQAQLSSSPEVPQGPAEIVPEEVTSQSASIRELVLESLKAAGGAGRKAAAIQAEIEERRDTKLHPKTCGMTLYRLSQDGLARREGRMWFYVPPKAETKNPGGDAPGPNGVFD